MRCFGPFIILATILCTFKDVNANNFRGFKLSCADTSPECLKQSLQGIIPEFINGIPELDITSLDPFQVDKLRLELPGEIKIEFRNAYTKGLKKCVVEYVRKVTEKHVEIQFKCDLFSHGKYRSTGRLLMFPINGEGNSTIMSRNLKVLCSFDLNARTKRDGEIYMEISNFKTIHKYDGRVIYNMTNLFKGNPQMSKVVLDFMNTNWRMVADEFGTPIIKVGINAVLNNIKKLLSQVPIKYLMIAE